MGAKTLHGAVSPSEKYGLLLTQLGFPHPLCNALAKVNASACQEAPVSQRVSFMPWVLVSYMHCVH